MIAASLLGGLMVLTLGADRLVAGASRLAVLAGISPLVVGLTVVAYGTSTPELVISVKAGLGGNPDLALGNVVGSNVFNVLFILGVAGLVAPLAVARQLVRLEVPIMIGASLAVWALALDGAVGRWDGLLLAVGIAAYTTWSIWRSRREEADRRAATPAPPEAGPAGGQGRGRELLSGLLWVGAGLVLLVVGARLFVDGSVALARLLGVSDLVIGLTIVAAGTSLPEVATSVVATLRGERDIAIGNVVGSNIYNLLAVLGVSALATPGGLRVAPALLAFDLPVMVAVAVACLPIFLTGLSIARLEAAAFLGFYLAYAAYLVLKAQEHDALRGFTAVMLEFVIPLAVLGIAVSLWRHFRSPAASR
ncbi:MAG: calcium/sodium antiporter [Anaeromyxobacter sp.]|nr:calcium/sodium antiporter [Anaeromyxobacter sp.]